MLQRSVNQSISAIEYDLYVQPILLCSDTLNEPNPEENGGWFMQGSKKLHSHDTAYSQYHLIDES